MKILKPIFWNKKNIISISIYPISYITKLINFLKNFHLKIILKLKQFVLKYPFRRNRKDILSY